MKLKKAPSPPLRKKPAAGAKTPTDAEILALFRQLAQKQESAAQLLDTNLARIEKAARLAKRNRIDEIHELLGRVRAACAEDNAVEAALYALQLADAWMHLRPAPVRKGKAPARKR